MLTVADGAYLNGDQYTGGIRGFGNSRIEITGGYVRAMDTLTSSVTHVTGGQVDLIADYTNALIGGGVVTELQTRNINNSNYNSTGQATISGGTVTRVITGSLCSVAMTGGALTGYFSNSNGGGFTLSGGTVTGTLYDLDQYSKTSVFGTGITLSNPVAGASKDFGGYTGTYYDLKGVLRDGTPINTKYFSNGALGTSRMTITNVAAAVPESPAALLLALPALALLARCVTRTGRRLAPR